MRENCALCREAHDHARNCGGVGAAEVLSLVFSFGPNAGVS